MRVAHALLAACALWAPLAARAQDALDPVRQGQLLLRQGSRGPAVAALQAALDRLGAGLVVDGAFGARTRTAVLAFQRDHGLAVDGVVGPRTVARLDAALAPAPPPPSALPPNGLVFDAIPPRPAGAPSGSAVLRQTDGLSRTAREARLLAELETGNVPAFLRRLCPVTVTRSTPLGTRSVTCYVLPDVLCVGDDADFVRVPLWPATAQRLADLWGCSLPTRRMSDAIHAQAGARLRPQPLPASAAMLSNAYFAQHQALVEEQRRAAGHPLGVLLAGHKKDVVITPRLLLAPGRVAIYGWHYPDGRPIQPLSTVHEETYADYSHGARLVWGTALLDGQPWPLADLLADPRLCALVSDEGPVTRPRYD